MQTATSLPPNADVRVLAGQSNPRLTAGCLNGKETRPTRGGHPSVISLLLNTNDPGPVSVAYGLGHHPHCALVDMRDMLLPAFLPIPL